MVPHRGTNWAAHRLTAQIGRDAVLSVSYGRGCRTQSGADYVNVVNVFLAGPEVVLGRSCNPNYNFLSRVHCARQQPSYKRLQVQGVALGASVIRTTLITVERQ